MAKLTLKASPRKVMGRKVKKLRGEGQIPSNVYGKKVKSQAITVEHSDFKKLYDDAGETSLVELDLGKNKKTVLIRNLQREPISGNILHVDFQEVDLKTKINAEIPIELIGEAPAEKQGLGTLVQHMNEVEVSALPADLPEKFEIDVSVLLEVDAAIHVRDVKINNKVTFEEDPENIIVKIEPLRKEEDVVVTPVEGEEGGEQVVPEDGAQEETSKEDKPQDEKAS